MLVNNNKITARQTTILFIVSTFSAAIRLFPSEAAEISGEAAWLTPFVAALPLLLNFYVLDKMFKNSAFKNLGEVIEASLGKVLGKAILTVFLLWCVLLYFLYIRYYADRLLSSIFAGTDIRFLLLVMMLLVFMTVRGRLEVFARFTELSFLVFSFVLSLFFILLVSSIKIENIYPVTHYDIVPVVKASYSIMGIWCYLPLFYFLGDNISDRNQILKYRSKTTIYLVASTIMLIISVVGTIGPKVVARMPLPFFNAVRLISISELFERMESVLLAIWVASDFIVINVFAFAIIAICKQLFNITEGKYLSAPISLLGYSGSQFLAASRFELLTLSKKIGLPLNIITFIILPFIIMVVGKLRKKI